VSPEHHQVEPGDQGIVPGGIDQRAVKVEFAPERRDPEQRIEIAEPADDP
jgi:hypothetical protein